MWIDRFGTIVLVACALAACGREPRPERSAEVFPVEAETPRTPQVESLFAAVVPSEDRWIGEVVTEELDGELRRLGEALRSSNREAVLSLLDEGFESTALEPAATGRVSAPPGTIIERHRYHQGLSLRAGELADALLERMAAFRSLNTLDFKIVGIEVEASSARSRVLHEAVGEGSDGSVIGRMDTWELGWRRVGTDWKMTRLRSIESSESRARLPFFTDVTAAAFGSNPSYWQQMRLGVDEFRQRVDAAAAIGVYGHNGVSVADVDVDGREDLYISQPSGLPDRLYRNRGDGSFEDVSREAGIDILDRTSMGLFADYDNDGDPDLFAIVQNRSPVLFVNDGEGRFEVSTRARFERKDGVRATLSSASMADYDSDGAIDLYVCSYRYFDQEGEDTQLALPYPYHDATNGPPNVLYRNRGDGTFEDVTERAGLDAGNDRFSFASSWGDFNEDGAADLYVANDFGRNNLYQNLGNGTFREVSRQAGVEDMGAGMSVAWADYDLDGREDLYVGNMWSSAGLRLTGQPGYQEASARSSYARHAKGSSLFRNRGDGRFDETTEAAGVELGRWAWSSDFLDADNDGDEDIYIANGFITNTSTKDL